MKSSKPYLIRGLYEWIVDNGLTPYVVVNTKHTGVRVPPGFSKNDRIVLDLSPTAVKELLIDNEWIQFNARFGMKSEHIVAPVTAILAIYAKENGGGMEFPEEEEQGEGVQGSALSVEDKPVTKKPNLTLVKK